MRPVIWRRIARLRAVAPLRHIRSYSFETATSPSTTHTTPLSSHFPLYRPSPSPSTAPAPYEGDNINASELPSDRNLKKSVKVSLTAQAIEDVAEYSEDDLREFYTALVESGREEDLDDRIRIAGPSHSYPRLNFDDSESEAVLSGVASRLGVTSSTRSADRLTQPEDTEEAMIASSSKLSLRTSPRESNQHLVDSIIRQLRNLAEQIDGQSAHPEPQPSRRNDIKLGILSTREWDVLLNETVRTGDSENAEVVAVLRRQLSTLSAHNDDVEQVIRLYAGHGSIEDVTRILSGVDGGVTDEHRDLLITAHLRQTPSTVQPALELLAYAAETGRPFPQSSYGLVLTHLTQSSTVHQSNSHTRALAWDLFANMRLSAHSHPSREIYRTMINACASSQDPQPERARDLWIEMTEGGSSGPRISPQREDYDAIIKALSVYKKTYLEAFDLLRQMLAKHADLTFQPFEDDTDLNWSKYVPGIETFTALLEGTKRAGDLPRARWIVSEVFRLQASIRGGEWKGIDEDFMSGVFMTYASWKPLVRKQKLRTRGDEGAGLVSESDQQLYQSEDVNSRTTQAHQAGTDELDASLQNETNIPGVPTSEVSGDTAAIQDVDITTGPWSPTSGQDAILEATALFNQILQRPSGDAAISYPFEDVRIIPRFVNSYLSIHFAHAATIESAREAWMRTWAIVGDQGVTPTGWSYMQAMERCATRGPKSDRLEATEWGEELWVQYVNYASDSGYRFDADLPEPISPPDEGSKRLIYLSGLGPRQVERCFRAIVRIHALSSTASSLQRAIEHVELFHTLFPPSQILGTFAPSPKSPFHIRLSDPTSTAEADTPPHLLWKDVGVLHERLVREERVKEIGWLTWLIRSYEGNLVRRRAWRVKGAEAGYDNQRQISLQSLGRIQGEKGEKAVTG